MCIRDSCNIAHTQQVSDKLKRLKPRPNARYTVRQIHSLANTTLNKRLLDILVCPVTKGKLIKRDEELWSKSARLAYPVRDGIAVLYEAESRELTVDELESLEDMSSS